MPDDKPGFFEPPGTPTFLGMDAGEWHALWYGILDTFGRFHEGDLTPDEDQMFLTKRHYFWAGQIVGIGARAFAGAGIIFLTSGDWRAAIISILALMVLDQGLGGSGTKKVVK